MSTGAAWGRIVLATAVSAVLVLTFEPAAPAQRLALPAAAAAGVTAGIALFVVTARRRPPLLYAPAVDLGFLALAAASEELLWRRLVLGELLRAGAITALAGSTLGFALAHRARIGLHLGTGAAFAGLYLATGALAASVSAHWAYNAVVLSLLRRSGGGRR